MRVVLQRVTFAQVSINGILNNRIENGYLLLVGFTHTDNEIICEKIAQKIAQLRIFNDELGKMNLNLETVNGSILSISQFTLYADCKKGNRPSFIESAHKDIAEDLFIKFNTFLSQLINQPVKEGVFGADMKIEFLNDGPVTIILDSKDL